MQHQETATARRLKLSLTMLSALFLANARVAPSTLKALVTRGLTEADGTLTSEGETARDAIETEVLDAGNRTPAITVEMPSGDTLEIPPGEITPGDDDSPVTAEEITAGTTVHADGVEVTITEDAHRFRDYGGVDVVALNGVTAGGVLFEGKALPDARMVRARDIRPGMTVGLVSHGEPLREVIVTEVRWVGDQVTIRAGSVEVTTGALTLFRLLNDGSLFEVA